MAQTRQNEGNLPLRVSTWTSIKTGKVLKSIPDLDKATKYLFSTDATNVRAFERTYVFKREGALASYDSELKQAVVFREYDLKHPRSQAST